MPSIHAVLFDYGLVLSGAPDTNAWEAMKTVLAANETAFHRAYWKYRHDYDRGALNGISYWQAVSSDLNHQVSSEEMARLSAEDVKLWTQPNKSMIEWAARLQRAGVKTGILSNIGDAMEAGILERCEWLSGFAHHTFSHRLGIAKPELAIYRHAAEGLGTDPQHILFIDDREENIHAATASGMNAIQYVNHEQFVAEMRAQGLGKLLDV